MTFGRAPLLSLLACWVVAGAGAAAAATPTWVELLPDLNNPKLQFGTGKVVNNQPEISPVLPAIPGQPSGWQVLQWGQQELLNVALLAPEPADPVLGKAAYAFAASDRHAHLYIFGHGPDLVYELYESGGGLQTIGGTDILLTAPVLQPDVDFGRPVTFSMQAKLPVAVATYDTPEARTNGAVLAQIGMSFIAQFPDPDSKNIVTLFLQVMLAKSGAQTRPFQIVCIGNSSLMTMGTLTGALDLPYAPDRGPLHPIAFSVSQYLAAALAKPIACGPGHNIDLPKVRPADVKLKSVYLGIETEDRILLPSSPDHAPQGHVEAAMQVSDLRLIQDN